MRIRRGKALTAALAAMAALVGGSQALAPASAFGVIDDGGVVCPEFLPCVEQKEEDGKGSEGPTVGNSDGGVIVVEGEAPDDPYSPGGRPLGTPPAPAPDGDAISPIGSTDGGARLDRKPPPPKPLTPKQKWDRLSEEKKAAACEEIEFAIENVKLAMAAFEDGEYALATEKVRVPGRSGKPGRWEWRRFTSLEEIRKRRGQLRDEWRWKDCNRWHPNRGRGAGQQV